MYPMNLADMINRLTPMQSEINRCVEFVRAREAAK